MYRALSIQFRLGLLALLVAFAIVLVLPDEGLEALGGFLALYFVFLLHLPLIPQLLYYFWTGAARNWLIWALTFYLLLMMGTALSAFVVVNDIDDAFNDGVAALRDPDGHELRVLAERMYRDSLSGRVSPADRGRLRTLIENVDDIDAADASRQPVLWYLAAIGDAELVATALQRGASVDLEGGKSSLLPAVRHGHLRVVEQLLEAGAAADEGSVLEVAVRAGEPEVVRALMQAGGDLAAGSDTLAVAVNLGSAEVVELLMDAGMRPPAGSRRLVDRPLAEGNEAMIAVLNRHGFGLDWGGDRDPIIFEAVGRCDPEGVASLLSAGASAEARNRRGESVLAYVVSLRTRACDLDAVRLQVARLLLDHGVDLGVTTPQGSGLVAVAIASGHLDLARRLVAAGAPLAPGHGRRTVLMLAAAAGAEDLMQAAIRAGQSPITWTDGGNSTSALLEAVRAGHASVVRQLLAAGAEWRDDISERNGFRHAASHLDVLELLLEHYELREDGFQNRWIRKAVEENGNASAVAMLERYGL